MNLLNFFKRQEQPKTKKMTKNTCLPPAYQPGRKGTKSRPILLLAAGLLWAGLAQAQESANASGGDATGSGGTVAYSIGQVVYTTNTGSDGSAAQGVQHAYEIFTIGIKETELNISLIAFPNPTTENLILQISDYNNEKLSFQLFDIQGKQLSNGQVTAKQTQINMNGLPTATYFINVVNQENKQVQSFKIIKN
ncbi:MAG: T9SS type A sorting domain-containing protein [Bacteroidetes bacterium]|nr:T9SS type A sorting domain-containing protein [Bacteroidota bacterium]